MTDKAISSPRRRLIEDMAIRQLGPKTQHHYIRHVKRFADFLAGLAARRPRCLSQVFCLSALPKGARASPFAPLTAPRARCNQPTPGNRYLATTAHGKVKPEVG